MANDTRLSIASTRGAPLEIQLDGPPSGHAFQNPEGRERDHVVFDRAGGVIGFMAYDHADLFSASRVTQPIVELAAVITDDLDLVVALTEAGDLLMHGRPTASGYQSIATFDDDPDRIALASGSELPRCG